MLKLFSSKSRPPHLGPYPLERLPRTEKVPPYQRMTEPEPLAVADPGNPHNVANALPRFFDFYRGLRDGAVRETPATIPADPHERSQHLKSFCYFLDTSQVGICAIDDRARLGRPLRVDFGTRAKPDTDQIRHDALTGHESEHGEEMGDPATHRFALAILNEYVPDPAPGDPGAEAILGSQAARAAARAAETAVVVAMYIRRLGWAARAHLATASELDHDYILLAAGLGEVTTTDGIERITNPYLGTRFGVAIVSTTLDLRVDRPLARRGLIAQLQAGGPRYWLGIGGTRSAWKRLRGQHRPQHRGAYPMEKIKHTDTPTTLINAEDIVRQPKRAEFFSRGAFGDLGASAKRESIGGRFVEKEPIGATMSVVVAEGVPLQFGEPAVNKATNSDNPVTNAERIRALCHFLGADIVGFTPAYEHTWYSHDVDGTPIEPYHKNAIVLVLDQSQETMSGSSGDDWISNSQSFRAYMRGAFLANVVAEHIRGLGWPAHSHSAWDEDVQHIPLCIHAGIGELSRIGETVLNPFLGPRFKDSIVTTDLPLAADGYVDFGLQDFCNQCNKCARECPCDAIPYGDKILFNGYEIWKPDVQRCANYRITNPAGALCGRCMATCPFQTESTLFNRGLLWAGIYLPFARSWLAKFDDWRRNGEINPLKKWWWDLEEVDGVLGAAKRVNARPLFFKKRVTGKKQQVAVFPPHMAPSPDATGAVPVDRAAGIAAQKQCAEDLQRLQSE